MKITFTPNDGKPKALCAPEAPWAFVSWDNLTLQQRIRDVFNETQRQETITEIVIERDGISARFESSDVDTPDQAKEQNQ